MPVKNNSFGVEISHLYIQCGFTYVFKVYLMTLSVTDNTVLDDTQLVHTELVRMWKSLLPSLRYNPTICLERPKKTMKNLSQDSWSQNQTQALLNTKKWYIQVTTVFCNACWIWLAPVTQTVVQSNQLINDYVFSRLGGQFRSMLVSHPNAATFWWWRHGARTWVHRQDGHPTTATSICTQWLLHHWMHSSGMWYKQQQYAVCIVHTAYDFTTELVL